MTSTMQKRVDAMFSGDRLWAIALLVGLWIAVGIVYLGIRSLVTDGSTALALIISALLIVGYNTASVIAMIRHYSHDKNWIYEIDIRHLDQMSKK
ncbi:MAG: hypothetical protein ACT4NU_08625 [Chromatiales bacterium]